MGSSGGGQLALACSSPSLSSDVTEWFNGTSDATELHNGTRHTARHKTHGALNRCMREIKERGNPPQFVQDLAIHT